jgi:hypothetical protein
MRVLMVGGSVSGQVFEFDDEDSLGVVVEDDQRASFQYERRTIYTHAGQEWVHFVCGNLDYDQVLEIVYKSDLSNTGKLRVLGPGHGRARDGDV